MADLLRIDTPLFELTIWATDISMRQKVYAKTVEKRSLSQSDTSVLSQSKSMGDDVIEDSKDHYLREQHEIKFSPALQINQCEQTQVNHSISTDPQHTLVLVTPLFFENTQYHFEWVFQSATQFAQLDHRSKTITDAFRFVKERGRSPARLTGTIQTGNNVGWLRLAISFEQNGKIYQQAFSFEILPTKMLLHHDLPLMYKTIDQYFPLWRFSLIEKTEQDASREKLRGHFLLMWLANFQSLRERLNKALKVIAQTPHTRLQSQYRSVKADRLKGRISHKLATKIQEDFANGMHQKHYQVESKRLNVDTPENQFIKMVLKQTKATLYKFEHHLKKHQQAPDNQRISESFLVELGNWQRPITQYLSQSFFYEVGEYKGLQHESLVLQQKTGYSAVYQIWQELKYYLDHFANQSTLSIRSVAEIYEIWCFLTIKTILENELGFEPRITDAKKLTLNKLFEYQLKDGFMGAFEFERGDGVKAKLIHEPEFKRTTQFIRTFSVNQKPDIVLEVTIPIAKLYKEEKQFIWLFDAKYRIQDNDNPNDCVPEDAINQMHRYRDALIRVNDEQRFGADWQNKSRPILGAFALYPGFFNQQNQPNPYQEEIEQVGIGAFALLPNQANPEIGKAWLVDFLKAKIGKTQDLATKPYRADEFIERQYTFEASRIPFAGMQQVLFPDLTLTISLGSGKGRSEEYLKRFTNGSAKWYHVPQSTFEAKFKQHIVEEIRFLALAEYEPEQNNKSIRRIWPVKSVKLIERCKITAEQAGKDSNSVDLYYLFELELPLTLAKPIEGVPLRHTLQSMKLTRLTYLQNTQTFNQLETVYPNALK